MSARDHAAGFEAFYRREYTAMVAVARALVGGSGAAEDLTQESFMAAHRHWARISGYDDPRAWVRRVLVNRATSFHRRRGAELRAVTRLGGQRQDSQPDISPEATEVWERVRRLPRRQAQAIALHYVDQLSVEEIGEVLGCSPGAVKTHLHRARTRLGRELSAWNEETA